MTHDDNSTASQHLPADTMSTAEVTQLASGNSLISFAPSKELLSFQCVVLILGVFGLAANALILYALVASKQHKKHALIVNQNALDLFSCLFMIVTYSVKICNVYLSGLAGFLLCTMIISESLIWSCIIGSVINLAGITVERYLKVVHAAWSKNKLRNWMVYSAMAFAWIASVVYNMVLVMLTTIVVDGVCYAYAVWKSNTIKAVYFVWNFLSFYVVVFMIFVVCYWRILRVIRHQAKVMAGHGAAGSSAAQAQTNHIQTNVIKTMILISALHVISWFPIEVYFLFMNVDPNLPFVAGLYYAAEFVACLYTCANPFIYATKFDPVKQVLVRMIPCTKTSEQAAEHGANSGTGTGTTTSRHAVQLHGHK